jgi:hypothetical protein
MKFIACVTKIGYHNWQHKLENFTKLRIDESRTKAKHAHDSTRSAELLA